MNELYDVLEICLQELEHGADMESVLGRYPDLASELRPILKASIKARTRGAAVTIPSPEVMRRGRAKLLQHAYEMRETKIAPRKRMIPLFQRLAISFTMTALFLASGTGLVGASSSALPGENLYPVKLTWENLRLFFTFDHASRDQLEHAFKDERLQEINELLVEGRHETIQFSGVFMDVTGQTFVSGIRILILDTTVLPVQPLVNGIPVMVTGRTNADGFVDVESIELLPAGVIVPTGEPPEIETQPSQDGNGNDNGNENINININENFNSNDNVNVNDNDNVNTNINDNDNANDGGTVNDNANDSGTVNDNTNDSSDDNTNTDTNTNDSGNDNGGSGGGGSDDNGGSSGGGGSGGGG